jgi:hypothetical protein
MSSTRRRPRRGGETSPRVLFLVRDIVFATTVVVGSNAASSGSPALEVFGLGLSSLSRSGPAHWTSGEWSSAALL